ncbi:ABC transporter ATP-binding protein [Bradyrhizobium commune]|uniref:ABC transporter ATP-binding protein n=1 Tax=Bradyrhizobium commune TaxID=83627 RepID=A0A7S9D3U1_9BRAD|nr:ABC transporter ATP-binding protein [Bradyrhizobium commune]QPF90699.1 ABC transporter ATP-binding protein [Bradyrhizobium commune]
MSAVATEWQLSGVSAGYADRIVLNDISFTLGQGQTMALIGHNGAGKSTLLKLLYGMLPPREGTITCRSRDLQGVPPVERMRYGISYMPEGRGVFPNITVEDNLKLGLAAFKLSQVERNARIERVVEPLPILREFFYRRAGLLSGGQQQMLSLARTLAANPKSLLLDEPSIGLAPKLFQDLLITIKDAQKILQFSIILVEQNVQTALRVADLALVLKAGRILYLGKPASIMDRTKLMELY